MPNSTHASEAKLSHPVYKVAAKEESIEDIVVIRRDTKRRSKFSTGDVPAFGAIYGEKNILTIAQVRRKGFFPDRRICFLYSINILDLGVEGGISRR